MACFPESGGCEHGRLVPFISYINDAEDFNWKHSACLDIQNRTDPQPEVLYEDEDGNRLVVEKKSVMWPLDYAKAHSADHYLIDKVQERLGPLLGSMPAILTVPSGACLNRGKIDQFATALHYLVNENIEELEKGKELSTREIIIPFHFRLQQPNERDEDEPTEGLCISFNVNKTYDLFDPANIPSVLIDQIQNHIHSAVKKFASYSGDRCILLFQTFAEIQWRDDAWWAATVKAAQISENFEIWVQDEDELEEGPFFKFRRIYPAN